MVIAPYHMGNLSFVAFIVVSPDCHTWRAVTGRPFGGGTSIIHKFIAH